MKQNPWKRLTRSEIMEKMSHELKAEKARIRAEKLKSKKEVKKDAGANV